MSEPCGGCTITSECIGGSCWHNTEHSNTLSIASRGAIIGPLSPSEFNRRAKPSPIPRPSVRSSLRVP